MKMFSRTITFNEKEFQAELDKIVQDFRDECARADYYQEQYETLKEEHERLMFAAARLCNVHKWSYGGPETLEALAEKIAGHDSS